MAELTPEERERIYLEEKERVEARQRLQNEGRDLTDKERSIQKSKAVGEAASAIGNLSCCIGCLGAAVVGLLILLGGMGGGK